MSCLLVKSRRRALWDVGLAGPHDICLPLPTIFKHFCRSCGIAVGPRRRIKPSWSWFISAPQLFIKHHWPSKLSEKRAAMSEPQEGRVIYLERDETGGPKWLLFQPLIRPRWVAAALIGAKLVINAISRPKWNKSAKLNIKIKIVCNTLHAQLPLLTNYGF